MSRLPLDQISPGALLAADARDRQGRLLLSAGYELSGRTLASLRFWGVSALDIVGETPVLEPEPTLSAEILEQARVETLGRFVNAGPSHPFLEALTSLASDRRAKDLAAAARRAS